jgi:hypothetical protein
MLILPFAVLVGLLGGWAMNGSWRALLDARLWHPSFVLVAIAVQASLELPGVRDWPSGLRFAIVLATYFVLGCWLFNNVRCSSGRARFAFAVVGGGWTLNFLAIALNGGMPVSQSALARAGIAPSTSVIHGHFAKHVPMIHGTVLRALGDVIPLSLFRSVVSPGDIVMAVGVGVLVAAAMRSSLPGDRRAAAPAPVPATQNPGSD